MGVRHGLRGRLRVVDALQDLLKRRAVPWLSGMLAFELIDDAEDFVHWL
jgi:hypothetical protein